MEDEQELKQQFLREEILEKNYDPQLFIDFLISKKGETAEDINNWSLDELKLIVIEFKNSHNISPKKESSFDKNEKTEAIKTKQNKNYISYYNEDTNNEWLFMNPETESTDITNNNSLNNSLNNMEHNIIELDCLEPDHSPLSNYEKINITVSSPKKEYESTGLKGFFMKTIYYTFLLENKELKINKRRRYTDFEWLRKTLLRLHPGYYVPPLPLNTINVSKPDKIEKYQRYLQRFIDGILEDKLFKNSSLFYLFLFTEKENDLISLMNKYDNVQKQSDLKYFYSRDGKIILDDNIISNTKINKLLKIKENISIHNNLFINLNKALKNLCQEMKQVSDRMIEIGTLFKEIYTKLIINSDKKNCKFYSDLEFLFKEYGKREFQRMENIKIELKEYLKFENLQYISSLKELYDSFEYEHDLYFKVAQNLRKKKETLFTNGPIDKWELNEKDKNIDVTNKEEVMSKILPKDTAIVNEIRKHLIYYTTQLDNEYQRLKEIIEIHNDNTYKIFIKKSQDALLEENKFFEKIGNNNNNNIKI